MDTVDSSDSCKDEMTGRDAIQQFVITKEDGISELVNVRKISKTEKIIMISMPVSCELWFDLLLVA